MMLIWFWDDFGIILVSFPKIIFLNFDLMYYIEFVTLNFMVFFFFSAATISTVSAGLIPGRRAQRSGCRMGISNGLASPSGRFSAQSMFSLVFRAVQASSSAGFSAQSTFSLVF